MRRKRDDIQLNKALPHLYPYLHLVLTLQLLCGFTHLTLLSPQLVDFLIAGNFLFSRNCLLFLHPFQRAHLLLLQRFNLRFHISEHVLVGSTLIGHFSLLFLELASELGNLVRKLSYFFLVSHLERGNLWRGVYKSDDTPVII